MSNSMSMSLVILGIYLYKIFMHCIQTSYLIGRPLIYALTLEESKRVTGEGMSILRYRMKGQQ